MEDDGRRASLEHALDELAHARRILREGRVGASPEWVAAAEAAVELAEGAVREAGGTLTELAEPDAVTDSSDDVWRADRQDGGVSPH